jgi:hypothetical protein
MKKIALLGFGNIGFRHLQGILKVKETLSIDVFDINPNAKDRLKDLETNHNIQFSTDLTFFHNKSYEVVIVATCADVRLEILRRFLDISKAKRFILEKIPFQSVEDYVDGMNLLKSIPTWINCPFRIYPSFQELKQQVSTSTNLLNMNYSGSSWGLACNSLHYLNLMEYLTDSSVTKIELNYIEEVYESKRKGFFDLNASLTAQFNNGTSLQLISTKRPELINRYSLLVKNDLILIDEVNGKITSTDSLDIKDFRIYYQSELTNFIIEKILADEDTGLSSLDGSFNLNKLFLNALQPAFSKENKLPIT